MTERFHDDLAELKMDVVAMGGLAQEMLAISIDALKNQDVELAKTLHSKKNELEKMDYEIEERALELLTLHQPMAGDMRTIATIMKMITYLTRVGLYGKDIGKIAEILADKPHVKKLISIPRMADIVSEMISDVMDAFENCEMNTCKCEVGGLADFNERDDEVDSMMESILRECLTYMMEDPKNISPCLRYVMVARYLERCADHACKMADKTYYMITGERIYHLAK
ncbi:MAG: phosphate signaling complex protein PhoU [Candidatus Thermoplasmatota archaeon]|nr:phosphate signaling complex protein PhoU [Candidatus Thermoplasmatota archaeon]